MEFQKISLFLQSELDVCAYTAPETGLGDGGIVVVFLVKEIDGIKIYGPAGHLSIKKPHLAMKWGF